MGIVGIIEYKKQLSQLGYQLEAHIPNLTALRIKDIKKQHNTGATSEVFQYPSNHEGNE